MKLNRAQKRFLIWTPIIIILLVLVFALLGWLIGAERDALVKAAFYTALAALCGFALTTVTSFLFNWPWKLKDDKD